MSNAFVVLNPMAGNSDAELIQRALERRLVGNRWAYEVYETTGEEQIAEIVGRLRDTLNGFKNEMDRQQFRVA